MDFDNIKIGLARVQSLVEGWENAGVTELERDLALEELRRIYTEIRFGSAAVANEPAAEAAAVAVPPVVAEASATAEEVADEEESDEPEIEVELIMSDEEESEEEEPTEAEQESEQTEPEEAAAWEPKEIQPEEPAEEEPELPETKAELPEKETEVKAEEPEDKPVEDTVVEIEDTAEDVVETQNEIRRTEQSLFGDEEIIRPRSARRRVIMSLYDDDMPIIIPENKSEPEAKPESAKEVAEEPVKAVEPVKEQPQEHTGKPAATEQHTVAATAGSEETVLGDVLRADVHTLGDSIARPKGIAESAPVISLRAAIGINDRFLLIRDLFDNDEIEYERAIVALDSFDNLDDCMIHIVENYSWRSSSDGAKLIMDLIQRKFRK